MTTTKEELMAQYLRVEQELKELKTKLEHEDEPCKWIPRLSDRMYYLMGSGDIDYTSVSKYWGDLYKDVGNYFKTRDKAELRLRQLKVLERMRVLAKGYEFNANKYNYQLYYNNALKEWSYFILVNNYSPEAIYFSSNTDALNAISVLGDDLNCLLENPY